MKNYRTTIAGAVLAGLSFLAIYQSNGGNLADWKQWLIPALVAIFGYLAKDAGVTGAVKLLIAGLCVMTLASCSFLASAAGRQMVVSLAELGVQAAVNHGKLSPGDALTINRGVAIVTDGDTTLTKVVKIGELGLQSAVNSGLVQDGDAVLIKEATAVITKAVEVPVMGPVQVPAAKNPVL
jgi:hypothetical protein